MHIIKSTKKQTEKPTKLSLIDDLLKRFLELEIKSNLSLKSKCSKWIAKRKCLQYKTWKKKTQSKIKPTKIWKEIGTTYCLGRKDYTHNFKPQDVKMTNELPVLFVDLVNQNFQSKSTTKKNNLATA